MRKKSNANKISPYPIGTILDRYHALEGPESIRLAHAVQAARSAQKKLSTEADPAKITELRNAIRHGKRARDQLVLHNARLVSSTIRQNGFEQRGARYGITFEDFANAGMVALIRAAEYFKPEKGAQFSTFAIPAIQREMQRLLRTMAPKLHIPHHTYMTHAIKEAIIKFFEAHKRKPTVDELATLGFRNKEAVRILRLFSEEDYALQRKELDDEARCMQNAYGVASLDARAERHMRRLRHIMAASEDIRRVELRADFERLLMISGVIEWQVRVAALREQGYGIEEIGQKFVPEAARYSAHRLRKLMRITHGKLMEAHGQMEFI